MQTISSTFIRCFAWRLHNDAIIDYNKLIEILLYHDADSLASYMSVYLLLGRVDSVSPAT